MAERFAGVVVHLLVISVCVVICGCCICVGCDFLWMKCVIWVWDQCGSEMPGQCIVCELDSGLVLDGSDLFNDSVQSDVESLFDCIGGFFCCLGHCGLHVRFIGNVWCVCVCVPVCVSVYMCV